MPNIPPGFLQVTVRHSCPDAEGEVFNVFGVDNNASGTADEAAETIFNIWAADVLPSMNALMTLTRVDVSGGNGAPEGTFSGSDDGGLPGAMAPINTSVLVKKVTGTAGRKFRGRFYFAGLNESHRTGSELTSGGVAQWAATATALLEDLAAADLPMVILHNGPGAPTVVAALSVETRLATQRGRLRD